MTPPPVYPGILAILTLLLAVEDAAEEARRLFELGDYPGAEAAIVRALAALPDTAVSERAFRTAQLAEVRMFQGIQEAAIRDIESALRIEESLVVRRSAVTVYLRTQHWVEALPHIEAILAKEPADLAMRFARGIVLAKTGKLDRSLEELACGLRIPSARREARFELALALARLRRPAESLAYLRDILEDDPSDTEAVYQASRQLLSMRKSRTAAHLTAYFQSLRDAEGPSSRDYHHLMTGKPFEAALERAERWERLGRYDKVLAEVARAKALRPDSPGADAWLDGFWQRQGLGKDPDVPALERALEDSVRSGDEGRALRAARLLLARDGKSSVALRYFVSRTGAPTLIVPRLHYLKLLSEVEPRDPRWGGELAAARRAFGGDAAERGQPPR